RAEVSAGILASAYGRISDSDLRPEVREGPFVERHRCEPLLRGIDPSPRVLEQTQRRHGLAFPIDSVGFNLTFAHMDLGEARLVPQESAFAAPVRHYQTRHGNPERGRASRYLRGQLPLVEERVVSRADIEVGRPFEQDFATGVERNRCDTRLQLQSTWKQG